MRWIILTPLRSWFLRLIFVFTSGVSHDLVRLPGFVLPTCVFAAVIRASMNLAVRMFDVTCWSEGFYCFLDRRLKFYPVHAVCLPFRCSRNNWL